MVVCTIVGHFNVSLNENKENCVMIAPALDVISRVYVVTINRECGAETHTQKQQQLPFANVSSSVLNTK